MSAVMLSISANTIVGTNESTIHIASNKLIIRFFIYFSSFVTDFELYFAIKSSRASFSTAI